MHVCDDYDKTVKEYKCSSELFS